MAKAEVEIEIAQRIFGAPPDLYLYLPAELRNRWEIEVGDRIAGVLEQVIKDGEVPIAVGEEIDWPVAGYWHELHIPMEVADRYDLKPGDRLELLLKGPKSKTMDIGPVDPGLTRRLEWR